MSDHDRGETRGGREKQDQSDIGERRTALSSGFSGEKVRSEGKEVLTALKKMPVYSPKVRVGWGLCCPWTVWNDEFAPQDEDAFVPRLGGTAKCKPMPAPNPNPRTWAVGKKR